MEKHLKRSLLIIKKTDSLRIRILFDKKLLKIDHVSRFQEYSLYLELEVQ